MIHDNRLRQLAAWLLHPGCGDDKPDYADCLDWLIKQPEKLPDGDVFRACMFRAANLPVYGRDQWLLLGWRERSPPFPRFIEPLHQCHLEAETVAAFISGAVVRLETFWCDECWDIRGIKYE